MWRHGTKTDFHHEFARELINSAILACMAIEWKLVVVPYSLVVFFVRKPRRTGVEGVENTRLENLWVSQAAEKVLMLL